MDDQLPNNTNNGGPHTNVDLPKEKLQKENVYLHQEIEREREEKSVKDVELKAIGTMEVADSVRKEQKVILLVGRSGNGKCSIGNVLLGNESFPTGTLEYSLEPVIRENDDLKVIVFPFIGDTGGDIKYRIEDIREATKKILEHLFSSGISGVDAIVLALKYGVRFTKQEKDAVKRVKEIFGKNVFRRFGIIAFSYGDLFDQDNTGEKTFAEWCLQQSGEVKELFDESKYRCVLFNNKEKSKKKKEIQGNNLWHYISNSNFKCKKKYIKDEKKNVDAENENKSENKYNAPVNSAEKCDTNNKMQVDSAENCDTYNKTQADSVEKCDTNDKIQVDLVEKCDINNKVQVDSTEKYDTNNKTQVDSAENRDINNKIQVDSVEKSDANNKIQVYSAEKCDTNNKMQVDSSEKCDTNNKMQVDSSENCDTNNKTQVDSAENCDTYNKTQADSAEKCDTNDKIQVDLVEKCDTNNTMQVDSSENFDTNNKTQVDSAENRDTNDKIQVYSTEKCDTNNKMQVDSSENCDTNNKTQVKSAENCDTNNKTQVDSSENCDTYKKTQADSAEKCDTNDKIQVDLVEKCDTYNKTQVDSAENCDTNNKTQVDSAEKCDTNDTKVSSTENNQIQNIKHSDSSIKKKTCGLAVLEKNVEQVITRKYTIYDFDKCYEKSHTKNEKKINKLQATNSNKSWSPIHWLLEKLNNK